MRGLLAVLAVFGIIGAIILIGGLLTGPSSEEAAPPPATAAPVTLARRTPTPKPKPKATKPATTAWVVKANAACARAQLRTTALQPTLASVDSFDALVDLGDRQIAIERRLFDELRALEPPADRRGATDVMFTVADSYLTSLEGAIAAIRRGDLFTAFDLGRESDTLRSQVGALAAGLGASRCAGAYFDPLAAAGLPGEGAGDSALLGGPTAKTAALGASLTLRQAFGEPTLDVTALRVVDPHRTRTPPRAGMRFVRVEIRIRNAGTAQADFFPRNDAAATDSDGRRYEPGDPRLTGGLDHLLLAPGESYSGYVTFELPRAARLGAFEYRPFSGYGPEKGIWVISR